MEKIIWFFKRILFFIFVPVPAIALSFGRRPRGEWNTWLLNGRNTASRHYDESVTYVFGVWIGISLTILIGVSVHFLTVEDSRALIDALMSILVLIWVIVSWPKIMTAYETWNWWKAFRFVVRMYDVGIRSNKDLRERLVPFLADEMTLALSRPYYSQCLHEFNHLEYVFRLLDIWKGQRADIVKLIETRGQQQ